MPLKKPFLRYTNFMVLAFLGSVLLSQSTGLSQVRDTLIHLFVTQRLSSALLETFVLVASIGCSVLLILLTYKKGQLKNNQALAKLKVVVLRCISKVATVFALATGIMLSAAIVEPVNMTAYLWAGLMTTAFVAGFVFFELMLREMAGNKETLAQR